MCKDDGKSTSTKDDDEQKVTLNSQETILSAPPKPKKRF